VDDALSGVAEVSGDYAQAQSALLSIAASAANLVVPEPTTANTKTLASSAETFSELVRRLAVTHGISKAMDADYGSRKEALAARDELVEAIDGLAESASTRGEHDSFEALRQLRADVVAAFRDKSGGLPGVTAMRLSAPTPALVVAYNLYQDLGRETEILRRNPSIHHPGLTPGGEDLEVLDA
jgi:prophage DNA circulation protein